MEENNKKCIALGECSVGEPPSDAKQKLIEYKGGIPGVKFEYDEICEECIANGRTEYEATNRYFFDENKEFTGIFTTCLGLHYGEHDVNGINRIKTITSRIKNKVDGSSETEKGSIIASSGIPEYILQTVRNDYNASMLIRSNGLDIFHFQNEYKKHDDGLIIRGGTGVGKTWASIKIISALIDKGYKCKYINERDYISRLRDAEDAIKSDLKKSDVIVFEDLAKYNVSDFGKIEFSELIDFCYKRGITLIVTTQFNKQYLANIYGLDTISRLESIIQKEIYIERR